MYRYRSLLMLTLSCGIVAILGVLALRGAFARTEQTFAAVHRPALDNVPSSLMDRQPGTANTVPGSAVARDDVSSRAQASVSPEAVSGVMSTAADETTTATVSVTPRAGLPTDTFTFSLSGFAQSETVVATFVPPLIDGLDFPAPDPATITVDASGAGTLTMRPVDLGAIVPGVWNVTFTGQTSGIVQTVSFAMTCGC